MNIKLLQSFAAILCIAGLSYKSEAAQPVRKEVAGRIILCDVWSPGASATQCTNPKALDYAVLSIRREGQTGTSRIFTRSNGRFSVRYIPGRYVVRIDDSYQKIHSSNTACDLISFPEQTTDKTLVVGPRNKKKDLYFEERCPV